MTRTRVSSAATLGGGNRRKINRSPVVTYTPSTPDELRKALAEAAQETMPTLINVMINPQSTRKPQKFDWLTR